MGIVINITTIFAHKYFYSKSILYIYIYKKFRKIIFYIFDYLILSEYSKYKLIPLLYQNIKLFAKKAYFKKIKVSIQIKKPCQKQGFIFINS